MDVRSLRPVDCDVHIPAPGSAQLLPYLDDYWADMIRLRGIDGLGLMCHPPEAEMSCRPDWRDGAGGLQAMRDHVFDPLNLSYAIGNCLHGAPAIFSEDLGVALVRAVNSWVAEEWLDREPRLRASILVHSENPERAVDEIERLASDSRFVQVVMLVNGRTPLGKRSYWTIYAAAERHEMPIALHAGSLNHHPSSAAGWASYFAEEYAVHGPAFQNQLLSFIAEGVFDEFPGLKLVLNESGFAWLPAFMWRAVKEWRAMRIEVPWVKRPPDQIIREHVRLTVQPVDAPPDPDTLQWTIDQIACDEMFLFATDYPHWHFDGHEVLPGSFPAALLEAACVTNPLQTYPRLSTARRSGAAMLAEAGHA